MTALLQVPRGKLVGSRAYARSLLLPPTLCTHTLTSALSPTAPTRRRPWWPCHLLASPSRQSDRACSPFSDTHPAHQTASAPAHANRLSRLAIRLERKARRRMGRRGRSQCGASPSTRSNTPQHTTAAPPRLRLRCRRDQLLPVQRRARVSAEAPDRNGLGLQLQRRLHVGLGAGVLHVGLGAGLLCGRLFQRQCIDRARPEIRARQGPAAPLLLAACAFVCVSARV